MRKQPLPPYTHLEFNTVYFTYLPVANTPKTMSNKPKPKPKRASKTKHQSSQERSQETHIGELPAATTPISPDVLNSSSAWQHANLMLKQQQMNSTLKSSEERDQNLSSSERSRESQSAHGYEAARIGSGSCYSRNRPGSNCSKR
ncbi:MAG: hypothetical protein SGBAC_012407 [Bacillariaceae sp.]